MSDRKYWKWNSSTCRHGRVVGRVWQFTCRCGRAFGPVPDGPSICWHAGDLSRVHGRNEVVVVVAAGVVCPGSEQGVKEAGVARRSWRPSLTRLEAEIAAVSAAISTFGVERKSEVEATNARAGSLEGGSRVVFPTLTTSDHALGAWTDKEGRSRVVVFDR